MKICPQCHKQIPLTENYFYSDNRFKSGFSVWCKKCSTKRAYDYYHKLGSLGKSRLLARQHEWQKKYDALPKVILRKKERMKDPIIKAKRNEWIKNWRKNRIEQGLMGRCKICFVNLRGHELSKYRICKNCYKGSNVANWKGGHLNQDGYRVISNGKRKSILQHRQVMEEHLNRKLYDNETVHHKNGVRHDNRIENLELWIGAPIRGTRVEDAIQWAKEILEKYTP